ncbi:hypothetical protein TIFTF001_024270 [Ficus carica]|uniref:Uncharacterized protein n=1 Tax=Ficus carica TaxID=3494 RepID=A0AA88DKC2_FICCA|nr:hypothetical protein TIFTF001_024270 [Ficus carica]
MESISERQQEGQELGFKDFTPPYLAPTTTGPGWRINLDAQIENFANTREDIISSIGLPQALELLKNALFTMAKLFNTQLKELVSELTTSPEGPNFVYADPYHIVEDILENYASYGPVFENANSACCYVAGRYGGLMPCGPLSKAMAGFNQFHVVKIGFIGGGRCNCRRVRVEDHTKPTDRRRFVINGERRSAPVIWIAILRCCRDFRLCPGFELAWRRERKRERLHV